MGWMVAVPLVGMYKAGKAVVEQLQAEDKVFWIFEISLFFVLAITQVPNENTVVQGNHFQIHR